MAIHVARIGEIGHREVAPDCKRFDELGEQVLEDRVDSEVTDRFERRDDEGVGNERQDVP